MAILIDVPTAPVSATPSLLATLQSIGKLCQTRSELSNEFESAFSSFLTDIPVVLSGTDGDILASSTSTNDSSSNSTTLDASTDTEGGAAGTTCAIESARPPNQLELEQVMEVWFRGEMELRESMAESLAQLKGFGREDLVRVVEQIERVEDARLKETISRDSLRRLGTLEPGENFTDAIAASNQKRAELAEEINDGLLEIKAEIADLMAGMDEEA